MPGFSRLETLLRPPGGGAPALQVINAGSGGVWSAAGTPTGWQWTTTADTTLLLACAILGADATTQSDFSALTFNGDPMTVIGQHVLGAEGRPRNAAPGQQWWFRLAPDIVVNGALAPTLNGWTGGVPSSNYSGIFLFNIKGAHATAPIGASDFPEVRTTAATGKSDSITSTILNSILLVAGAVQGGTSAPPTFSAADGVNMLGAQVSTGLSGTIDGTFAGGWKQLGAAGAQAYGWTWVKSDGHGISAVEVKPA